MHTRQRRARSTAAGVLALVIAPATWGTPAALAPGASGVPIPIYSSSGTPTVKVLFDTGLQSQTAGGVTVTFDEMALQTSLNPGGVTFGFEIASSNTPTALGSSLPGFAGFTTAVESCDPFTGSPSICGTRTGTAARSSGSGDLLTFSDLGTTPIGLPGQPPANASNLYGIFTNAPAFHHPTSVVVSDDGQTFAFSGIGASGSAAAPEPGSLALLGLGLLAMGVVRRRAA